jgi:radical SAM superfamily enzyme YgiQ (UPF0313 family)
MARIVFITLYDELCNGVRLLKAGLRRAGHQAYLVCWKQYTQTPIEQVQHFYDGMHIEVYPKGDMVNSYSYPSTPREKELLLSILRELEPDLICFGLTNSQKYVAADLTRLVRQHLKTPIMWGGHHATTDPEWCLQYSDFVCRGESDHAILEIAERIANGKGVEDVRNVWLKANGGKIIQNPQRPLILDLDSLPFPDHDADTCYFIDHDTLSHAKPFPESLLHTSYMTITVRGCPYHCSYCYNSYFKKLYPRQRFVRFRSIPNVIAELKETKQRMGHFYLEILDPIFTLRPKHVAEFVEAYHREVNEPFWCYTHPRLTRERAIAALAGCEDFQYIIMGIQSASSDIADKRFHRVQKKEDILRGAAILNKYCVRAFYDIITNVPGETPQDCRRNLDLLRSLPKPFRIRMSKISLFPNYDITTETGEKKFVTNPMYRVWNALYFLSQDVDFSDEEVDALLRDKELFEHPTILEKLSQQLIDYEKEKHRLSVIKKLNEETIARKDEEIACLQRELAEIRYRKGFRYFMALSGAARKAKGAIKRLLGKR